MAIALSSVILALLHYADIWDLSFTGCPIHYTPLTVPLVLQNTSSLQQLTSAALPEERNRCCRHVASSVKHKRERDTVIRYKKRCAQSIIVKRNANISVQKQKRILLIGKGAQEEQNGTNFSFVAPSSEELLGRNKFDQNALL